MRTVGRLGLIALTFLVVSVPAGAVCEALGDWMAGCHQQSSHDMSECSDEAAVAPSCCASSLSDSETDLVLKRPGEEDLLLVSVLPSAIEAMASDGFAHLLPEVEPPPRPPGHALFSTLLL